MSSRVVGVGVVVAAAGWLAVHATSPTVRSWTQSKRVVQPTGELVAAAFGGGDTTVLLLHGLGATGDYWPDAYDRLGEFARVVVPDLLGFGRSLDGSRSSFALDDHLDALDTCVERAAPETKRFIVVAHLMGSGLALGLAGRHPDRTVHVVLVGAPVYPDPDAATGAFDAGSHGKGVPPRHRVGAAALCVVLSGTHSVGACDGTR